MISLLLALVGTASGQSHQDYTFDIERFRPNADTYGYAVTDGASTLQNLQVGFGVSGYYAEDELVLILGGQRPLANGAENGDGMLDNRSGLDLQLGLGISKYFSLCIDMPFFLWQEGTDPAAANRPLHNIDFDLDPSGTGDIRVSPKLIVIDLDDYPVGLALMGTITAPTGEVVSFQGEGDVTGMPMLVIEAADGLVHRREYRVRSAVNVGYFVRGGARYRDLVIHNEFVYRWGFSVHPSSVAELGVDLNGAIGGPRVAHKPLEVMPWIKLMPQELVTITGGGGFGVLPGLGAPDFRIWAAATVAPGFDPARHDSDKDGIMNDKDQCKLDPEDIDKFQDEDGCPDPDNDKDGIADGSDHCVDDPEDMDGFKDDDGCPDLDNDKDNILDLADRCPDEAEIVNDFQDEDGCPDTKPIYDTDGDSYKDDVDRCPYDAEDFDDFQDEDGCPEPDNDQDTILDKVDKCPNQKEIFNGVQDDDGCPDDGRVIVEATRIRITDTIQFEVNKATIRTASYSLMDEIARVILDHPNIKKIRVEGHTDSDGNDSYNLKLSQARATSVVNYLVASGVSPSRLDPVGFGETRPLVGNDTPMNKAINRRVEFLIVDQQ